MLGSETLLFYAFYVTEEQSLDKNEMSNQWKETESEKEVNWYKSYLKKQALCQYNDLSLELHILLLHKKASTETL